MIKNQKKLISEIIPNYINQLKIDKIENITFNEANTTILLMAEAYEILEDYSCVDEILLKNMTIIRNCIIENKIYNNPAIFDGLSESALSVHAIYMNTGKFEKFYNKINEILVEWSYGFLEYIDIKNDLCIQYYDAVLGLSGICNYFMLINVDNKYNDIIYTILNKLVYISGITEIKDYYLPNWYIKKENLMTKKDKEVFKNGYLNFGLSHGIAGPLVILSKAYAKGLRVNGQLNAIHNILKEYKSLQYMIDGSHYWTGLLKPEYYLEKCEINDKIKVRESWCYGALSIANCLLIAGECINDIKIVKWAYDIILEKVNLDINEYMLDSTTLCHGYAGVLSILMNIYSYFPHKDIKNRIKELENLILKSYDEKLKYGFIDIEIKKNENNISTIRSDRNTFIDGAGGVILSLLTRYNYGENFYLSKLLIK